jgi:superfamily II DNA or RNA helicase
LRLGGNIASTFALLGPVDYIVSEEAVADKTVGVTIQEVRTGIKITDDCLSTDGTLDYVKLVNYLETNNQRTELIAQKILENKEHSNFILSDRLNHLRAIIRCVISLGIPENQIRMIDGKTATSKREAALDDMRLGKARFLFASYGLGKEGLNIPNLDRLYLTLPHKDFTIVTQSIGRISRATTGKDSAICYDFVDEIGFCIGGWKQRKTIYNKKGCLILKGVVPEMEKSLFCF